jgi:[ribosomal protein S5]-alanine N-acetyltransferase
MIIKIYHIKIERIGNMNLLAVNIETNRLLLTPISHNYIEEINKLFISQKVKSTAKKLTEKTKDTKIFIEESLERLINGIDLQMIILNKGTKEFIGLIGLYKLNTLEPFVKISTIKLFHKNGYGVEAMNGIIEWAKRNIKYNYIYYDFNKSKITNKKTSEEKTFETMKIIKANKK